MRTHLPWRLVAEEGLAKLDMDFKRALESADIASTIAYFWPDPPAELVHIARERGILSVREMINTACASSGPILDAAYRRLGLPLTHPVSEERIVTESNELRLHDFHFASNPEVEKSLLKLGVKPDQILSTTFGWKPSRFEQPRRQRARQAPRFLFVGSVSVRKGVPELLDAWARAGVEGELILAGRVAPELKRLVQNYERSGGLGRVRAIGFRKDVASLFHSADVFVFPTLEEGGPQVTYEAAGCGLPVITTPMGAARVIESGHTGILVDPGSVDPLIGALRLLAEKRELRVAYGAEALRRSAEFTYEKVGARRCLQMVGLANGEITKLTQP
jgi:glycosyltransferase involved in cell wall biosynthesis